MPENEQQQPARPAPLPQGKIAPPTAPATGTATVTVACKIPAGISFALGEMVDDFEPVMGGGQKAVRRFEPSGVVVVLRGPARDLAAMKAGKYIEGLAGGFTLNPGIRQDYWEKVLRDYHDHPAIRNQLVFAKVNTDATMSEARNLAKVETGFEGIDPNDPAKRTGIRSVTRAERPGAAA